MTDTPLDLADVAQVYVTHRAAAQYAEATGAELEAARRELTAYLQGARPVDREVSPERWRYRRGRTGVDVAAAVTLETVVDGTEPLAIVVGLRHVRGYRGGRR